MTCLLATRWQFDGQNPIEFLFATSASSHKCSIKFTLYGGESMPSLSTTWSYGKPPNKITNTEKVVIEAFNESLLVAKVGSLAEDVYLSFVKILKKMALIKNLG